MPYIIITPFDACAWKPSTGTISSPEPIIEPHPVLPTTLCGAKLEPHAVHEESLESMSQSCTVCTQPATDTQDSRVGLSSVYSRVYETESPIVPALNRIRRVSLPGGVSSSTSLSPLTHL